MAHLLMIAHRLPYPPNKGDKIRAFHVMTHLAAQHDVRLACLIDDADDLRHVEALSAKVADLAFERIDGRMRRLLSTRSLVMGRSVTVTHFHRASLQRRIDEWIDQQPVDGVMCSSSASAEYLFRSRHWGGALRQATKVMDLIDVDSTKWSQYAETAAPPMSWVYRHEAETLGRYEQRIVRAFDRTFLVSPAEARLLGDSSDEGKVGAFANGVDLSFFTPTHAPRGNAAGQGPLIVFTGVMDYRPNIEGVEWFAREVFPGIRTRMPDARFAIVGSRPVQAVQALAEQPGVIVTGFVEDVRDWLARASVCVAPLLIARGIQNKVLEAMAMGRAVVATPQAFEGVEAQAGRDVLVAGSPAEFAQTVLALLADKPRAEAIGRNARECMEQRYRWASNLAVLDEVFA
jgi:sugar transferase (PEP-CTERM/EpsH1 system associated)